MLPDFFFQIFCVPLVREHELCETSVPCYLRHLPVASGSLPAVNLWGAQTSSGSTPLSRRYPKSTWPLSNTTNSARKTSVGLKPFTLIASILLICCTNCCGESIFYRQGANRQGNNTNHGFNAFNSNARKIVQDIMYSSRTETQPSSQADQIIKILADLLVRTNRTDASDVEMLECARNPQSHPELQRMWRARQLRVNVKLHGFLERSVGDPLASYWRNTAGTTLPRNVNVQR